MAENPIKYKYSWLQNLCSRQDFCIGKAPNRLLVNNQIKIILLHKESYFSEKYEVNFLEKWMEILGPRYTEIFGKKNKILGPKHIKIKRIDILVPRYV